MNTPSPGAVSRRQFITASTAATAWCAFSQTGFAQVSALKPSEQRNVAIVGCGNQGRVLINDCLKLPYVKVCAVCDIYQRRHNPRYIFIKKKLLDEAHLFGQITHGEAQWHTARSDDRTCAKRIAPCSGNMVTTA